MLRGDTCICKFLLLFQRNVPILFSTQLAQIIAYVISEQQNKKIINQPSKTAMQASFLLRVGFFF